MPTNQSASSTSVSRTGNFGPGSVVEVERGPNRVGQFVFLRLQKNPDLLTEIPNWDGQDVVATHDRVHVEAIRDTDGHLGGEPANLRRNRGDSDSGEMGTHDFTRQDKNRSHLVELSPVNRAHVSSDHLGEIDREASRVLREAIHIVVVRAHPRENLHVTCPHCSPTLAFKGPSHHRGAALFGSLRHQVIHEGDEVVRQTNSDLTAHPNTVPHWDRR